MAKHVFEIKEYGRLIRLIWKGELVKETKHVVTFKDKVFTTERRNIKTRGTVIVETDDPKAICSRYEAAYAKHRDIVEQASNALRAAEQMQRMDARRAAFGDIIAGEEA